MPDYSNDFLIRYGEASCTISFRCFDTPNSVTIYGVRAPDYDVESLLIAVRRTCLEFHQLWSFSIEESDIARINSAEGNVPIQVDERTARLLQRMKEFHDQEPAFDFTVGPVSFLWKHARAVPADDEIARALQSVGAGKVQVEDDSVCKERAAVQVDVGGAAKGFVADAIADQLRASGVESADIDLGGNLFMLGSHPEGRPWRVSVRVPEGVAADPPVVEVRNGSVVTSGSYERFVEIDGVRYQHIVDARTGRPARSDLVSATVVCPSSLQADMLATTALILGSEGLPGLRDRHPDCTFVVF